MNIAIIDDISTDAEALKNIAVSYFEKNRSGQKSVIFSAQKNFLKIISPENFRSCSWIFIWTE